jgi:hypothetical protein
LVGAEIKVALTPDGRFDAAIPTSPVKSVRTIVPVTVVDPPIWTVALVGLRLSVIEEVVVVPVDPEPQPWARRSVATMTAHG